MLFLCGWRTFFIQHWKRFREDTIIVTKPIGLCDCWVNSEYFNHDFPREKPFNILINNVLYNLRCPKTMKPAYWSTFVFELTQIITNQKSNQYWKCRAMLHSISFRSKCGIRCGGSVHSLASFGEWKQDDVPLLIDWSGLYIELAMCSDLTLTSYSQTLTHHHPSRTGLHSSEHHEMRWLWIPYPNICYIYNVLRINERN